MPAAPFSRSLLDHFSALKDPRQSWRVVYPFREILLLTLCGTIAGMEDFVEIRAWGNLRLPFLRRFLPFERGIPSHDTLNDVLNAVDPELFKTCFLRWVGTLRDDEAEVIAIDGKTSRRTHARGAGREPLHLVSAWATRQRLVLGQEAVAEKSNEINAIPLLLERLELTGALVTIDAIGTQAEIAKTIVRCGGDYLLALKANRPATHADVVAFFDEPPPEITRTSRRTPTTAASRSGATASATRSTGSALYSTLSRRAGLPPPRGDRNGRGPAPSRPASCGSNAATISPPPCSTLGPSPPPCAPTGAIQLAALGPRRRLPRRSGPPQDRPRAAKHGHRQAHGHEHDPPPEGQALPQGPQKGRRHRRELHASPRQCLPQKSLSDFSRL